MREKTKKATFNLHPDVITALDEMMAEGIASSKNALVEQAIRKELKDLRKQIRRKQWEAGVKDTKLMKDIEDTDTSFKTADAETARRIG